MLKERIMQHKGEPSAAARARSVDASHRHSLGKRLGIRNQGPAYRNSHWRYGLGSGESATALVSLSLESRHDCRSRSLGIHVKAHMRTSVDHRAFEQELLMLRLPMSMEELAV